MAPEQAAASPAIDARADLYSFGILAYELLAGRPPFHGRSPQAVLAAQVAEVPEPVQRLRPNLPPALAALIMRCLEKHAADRPQTAAEVVHALDAMTTPSGGSEPAAPLAASASAAKTPRRRPPVVLAGVALGAVVIAAGYWITSRSRSGPAAAPSSVAVLPFENVGGDSAQEYFSDGMTDDIASALVNDGVRVAPRASSYFFKGKRPTPGEVGAALGVDAVLTAKVSRFGSRLHVVAELARAKEGVPLWSYSVDRDTKDVFTVQRTITDSIIAGVRSKMASAAARVPGRRPESPQAHDLVLQGRYAQNLADRANITRSIDLFKRALAIEPTNASAYTGLAYSYAEIADGFAPPIDVYPRAFEAVQHALELDSTLAEAWSMRANLNVQYEHDWPSAKRDADRARSLNPNDVLARWTDGLIHLALGQRDQMVAPIREAAQLDPLNPLTELILEWMYIFSDQPDSAIAAFARADSLLPGFAYLDAFGGYPLAQKKRIAEAENAFRKAEPMLGHRSPGLAWLLATTGRQTEARVVLAEIERDWKEKYVAPELIAWAYLALGDKAQMYRWLEKGVEVHSAGALFNMGWTPLRVLHGEPRFRAILRRLNMPDSVAAGGTR